MQVRYNPTDRQIADEWRGQGNPHLARAARTASKPLPRPRRTLWRILADWWNG